MSEDGIRNVLGNLPSDLNETYTRALVEIIHQGATQIDLAQKAFRWIVAARRTLTLDELREAVSIEAKDKSVDLDKVPEASQVFRACGKLVVYDHQDRSIHLAHYTVQQFLVSDVSLDEIDISRQITNFHFRSEVAEIEAANICVTYLMFNDFEDDFERERTLAVTQSEISHLTATSWIPDMPGLVKKTKSDMLIFLRKAGFSRPSVDINQYFNLLLRPCRAARIKHRFLDYIINHWVEHTIYLEGSHGMIESFAELVLNHKIYFNFRPWGDGEIGMSDRLCENMFRWALKNDYGHIIAILLASSTQRTGYKPFDTPPVKILDHLVSSYINCLVEEELPLYYAAKMGYERTLQVFLSNHGQKLFSYFYITPTIKTAITIAISNGHERAAMLLLETFAGTPEFELGYDQNTYYLNFTPEVSSPRDKNTYFPLHLAVKFRLKKVVGILLSSFGYEKNAAINGPDTTGLRPVHYCSQNGDLEILKLLYSCKPYPNTPTDDDEKSTALYLALYNGHEDVVKFLLGIKACVDEKTYTLALKTTQPGHLQVLEAISLTLEASI
jgi:ankyrin repeat protein